MADEPSHSGRIEGPTPAGGSAAIAYFFDAEGRPCPKGRATSIEVHELDAAGNAIRRTYAGRGPDQDKAE